MGKAAEETFLVISIKELRSKGKKKNKIIRKPRIFFFFVVVVVVVF